MLDNGKDCDSTASSPVKSRPAELASGQLGRIGALLGAQAADINTRILHSVLVLRPNTRGIPDMMVCRILMFLWSSGSPYTAGGRLLYGAQRAQYATMAEYTLNHLWDPEIIEGYWFIKRCWAVWVGVGL